MNFIDVNSMIGEWGESPLRFKTAEGLLSEMDILNINRALVFDSKSWLWDVKTGNRKLLKALKGHDRLDPVIVLTPLVDEEFGGESGLLNTLKEHNIRAVRLFPFDQNFTLHPWNIRNLFTILNDIRMPVLLECRGMAGSIDPWFNQIYEIAGEFPQVPIILLTVGYRSLRILYELFKERKNIHVDTSTFITYHGIEDVVSRFGSERILFGTKMPFIDGGVSVGRILYAQISGEDKENIAGNNIIRLIRNCTLDRDCGGEAVNNG